MAPASQKHGPAKLLSDFEQEFLLESLIANPSTYLSELCEQLEEATGRVVHPSTICRTIQHFGMTRIKVRTIAMQRSEDRRAEFIAEISQFAPDMQLWRKSESLGLKLKYITQGQSYPHSRRFTAITLHSSSLLISLQFTHLSHNDTPLFFILLSR